MDIGGCGLGERRSALEAARDALEGFVSVVHEASGAELAELMGLVDAVAAKAGAARAVLTVEAVGRGEVAESGLNTHAWVREHAPSLRQGGAGDVAKLAGEVAPKGSLWQGQGDGGGVVDPDSPLGIVWAGVVAGQVSPGLATAILREVARLEPFLEGDAVKASVTRGLLTLGVAWGRGSMRRLRPALLAQYGRAGALDDLQERLGRSARLSSPHVESGDLTQYELLMTPEQAAALEAAIGELSAPAPNPVTGERDLRPAGQRRVEALAEVCRRSSAADADTVGGVDGAAGSGTAVHVIIDLEDLREATSAGGAASAREGTDASEAASTAEATGSGEGSAGRTGSGEVVGSTATGTILSPAVVRRLACEAALIPHVLGSAGEDLDLGRVVRLFTRAQRRTLLRRDRGCTYPGCTAPAAWCQAHHVVHWLDGGRSDLDSAALLCQRHHTFVHQRRLVAQVRATPDEAGRYVVWDLNRGSYDRHLERLRAERAAHDPIPLTPERLAALIAAIQADDPLEKHWAQLDLDQERYEDEQYLAAQWGDEGGDDDGWGRTVGPGRVGPERVARQPARRRRPAVTSTAGDVSGG